MTIEAKRYGADSTPEEVRAIRDRVRLYQPGIILYEETPLQTEFSLGIIFDRIEELLRENPGASLLVDLTIAERPNAQIRDYLRTRFARLGDQLQRIAVFTGKNFLLNTAAKFVLSGMAKSLSVHSTQAEAEEVLRHAAK